MEQISLETTIAFRLSIEEQRRLYLALALSEYRYQRHPNYNEKRLLTCLSKDIKRFLLEAESLSEKEPNNRTLNNIRTFFEYHHKHLKSVIDISE